MGIKILSIEEAIEDSGIKILCYGPAGSGKTILACTTGRPTLLLSAEGGLLSVRGAVKNGVLPKEVLKRVKVVEITTMHQLEEIRDWLTMEAADGNPVCDWVALDSITEIAERVLSNELAKSPDPRQAYGALQKQINDILRDYRDLVGYNVYMSAKQVRGEDDSGKSIYLPMMPGTKLGQQLPFIFDEVWAMRAEPGEELDEHGAPKMEYFVQTRRDRNYEAKDRSGMLAPLEVADLETLADKMGAVMPTGEEALAKARARMEEVPAEEDEEPEQEVEAEEQEAEEAEEEATKE